MFPVFNTHKQIFNYLQEYLFCGRAIFMRHKYAFDIIIIVDLLLSNLHNQLPMLMTEMFKYFL